MITYLLLLFCLILSTFKTFISKRNFGFIIKFEQFLLLQYVFITVRGGGGKKSFKMREMKSDTNSNQCMYSTRLGPGTFQS